MSTLLDGPREEYVNLPGLRMHYVEMGDPAGEPVILLHGFPEFWYSWRFQMRALAGAGYRAIAPDQRGYNLTEKQGPFDTKTLCADIANLQDALGIARCHVAGHDWGGPVAWGFATLYPERVDRLVTINGPHPAAYMDACKRSRQIFRSWYFYFFQLPRVPEWALRRKDYRALRAIFKKLPSEYMSPADIQHYVDALSQPGVLTAAINWYRALPGTMLRRKGGGLPRRKITAPTRVIWGERDPALDKACNDTLPRYVEDLDIHFFPDGTHWVQLDHPEEVSRLLIDFFGAGQ